MRIRLFLTLCLTLALAGCAASHDGPANGERLTAETAAHATQGVEARPTGQPAPEATPSPLKLEALRGETNPGRPLIMVHYMPWYQSREYSAAWGWHWTMNHFNPNEVNEEGRRPIASHTYPLTGPYDSSDPHLLEYQAMLMKISGIDGVIVDWYGFESFWDYGKINASTHRLFDHIQDAGLRFAVTYEDRTVQNMLENGHPNVRDARTHGGEVMQYLQEHWFLEDAYLKAAGRPVLFVFGNPPFFSSNQDWSTLFSGLKVQPLLVTQDGRLVSAAESSFPWPPMHLSGGGDLPIAVVERYLDAFYAGASGWDFTVAAAFPGFHDIYAEAGVGPSYGFLDANDGGTLAFTLARALESDPDVIQIVTWNDYGEGTTIEPTVEYGYAYLEMIQREIIRLDGGGFPYAPEDLAIPLRIFEWRAAVEGSPQANALLDNAVTAVLAGRTDLAAMILEEIDRGDWEQ